MAASNPWAHDDDARAPQHRVALGGLRAFVQRNELAKVAVLALCTDPLAPSSADANSSIALIRDLDALIEKKSSVLTLTRELEQLEREIATAGCMLPHQLQLRIDSASALHRQLSELLAMQPVLVRTLNKDAGAESIAVEMGHQRAFIDLFLKIGGELPRYPHVLNTLDGMALIDADLAARQREFERIVANLATTITNYQTLCDDISKLRDEYAQMQTASGVDIPSYAA